jgi:hypothetical protein
MCRTWASEDKDENDRELDPLRFLGRGGDSFEWVNNMKQAAATSETQNVPPDLNDYHGWHQVCDICISTITMNGVIERWTTITRPS